MRMNAVASAVGALMLLGACAFPASPNDEVFDRVSLLCGKAYAGMLVSTDEVDAGFREVPIVMHVATCSDDEIRIPLHVGDDRSRTWVISRTSGGLRLKHVHRHEDGEEDDVSRYGGDSTGNASGSRTEFPADAESIAMFEANGLEPSVQNVWAMEVRPTASLFAYEMARPNRFFRIEFDTSEPVTPPPPAWGEGTGSPE